MPRLILASSSPYRRELLQRLKIPFITADPAIDERPHAGELPLNLALRLAEEKAAAVAQETTDAWVIGSDQVAELSGQTIGKPGNRERAFVQLKSCQGQAVTFHTGLCLTHYTNQIKWSLVEPYSVQFRVLDDSQITRYIDADQPFDCAGAFKAEALGISLFEKMHGDDPTSLIGLPLIKLTALLNRAGFRVP